MPTSYARSYDMRSHRPVSPLAKAIGVAVVYFVMSASTAGFVANDVEVRSRVKAALRVASVAFVNARPLIAGLELDEKLELKLDVPSRLLGLIRSGQADVALLPVIDLQREAGLRVVPAGGIGCDGATLTVRLFSQTPLEKITTLACDPDSHTSVALARLVLERQYHVRPELIDLYAARGAAGEARLLIGDKVVCEEPVGFEHQLDLGAAWKQMTGLPFVFAVWCARAGVELGDLPARLVAARDRGMGQITEIVARYAVPRGWPAGIAIQYLTTYLRFGIGKRELSAIRLFHQLAAEHGIIDSPPRPLDVMPLPMAAD